MVFIKLEKACDQEQGSVMGYFGRKISSYAWLIISKLV